MDLGPHLAAVVTGGGSGLGAATARHLAGCGVKVAVFDCDASAGQQMADAIGGVFCAVDVADALQMRDAFTAARAAHGAPRILVTCAGIAPAQKTVSRGLPHDPALFARTLAVNLTGTFTAAALAAADMVALPALDNDGARGVIVMTASIAGIEGQAGQVAYGASKAGVIGLTLPMARDLGPKGVRVMTIAPGIFDTPMLQGMGPQVPAALAAQVPHPPRAGRAEEYAALVEAILRNDLLNGTVIRLDGALRLPAR